MKIFHMIVEHNTTRERKEYLSKKQGAAPPGWTCVGVCGFHEMTKKTIKGDN